MLYAAINAPRMVWEQCASAFIKWRLTQPAAGDSLF